MHACMHATPHGRIPACMHVRMTTGKNDRMHVPPCHRSRVYTAPAEYPPETVAAAVAVCLECPLRAACAAAALEAGVSLDGNWTRPAAGVIAAGVVCPEEGTEHAAQLAAVAGVPLPEYRDTRPRNHPEDRCRSCRTPMTSWTRTEPTEGYAMHYARGFCAGCRIQYRLFKAGRWVEEPAVEEPPEICDRPGVWDHVPRGLLPLPRDPETASVAA